MATVLRPSSVTLLLVRLRLDSFEHPLATEVMQASVTFRKEFTVKLVRLTQQLPTPLIQVSVTVFPDKLRWVSILQCLNIWSRPVSVT